MQSSARIVAEAGAGGPTRLTHLAGDGALTVRSTPSAGRVRVHLVAGAFGPLGGDELCLQIVVGPGAELEVAAVAATIVQRSRDGQPSRMDVQIDVAEGGRLVVALPPTVVTKDARHTVDARLTLAAGARLLLREETVRGRTGEAGGAARLLTRLDVDGSPVLRQELELSGEMGGPWHPRAVGSLLSIGGPMPEPCLSDRAAWMSLPRGAGQQFVAVSDDPLELSQLLDRQLSEAQLLGAQLPR